MRCKVIGNELDRKNPERQVVSFLPGGITFLLLTSVASRDAPTLPQTGEGATLFWLYFFKFPPALAGVCETG